MGFEFGKFWRKDNIPNNERITVRQGRNTPEDREAARALMQETFDYHEKLGMGEPGLTFKPASQASYMEECISALLYGDNESVRALLAFRGKQAVGFALVRIMSDYYYTLDHYGYIEQLIVTEQARQQGAGAMLLEACYDWLKSRRIHSATLKVYGTNRAALRFYEREGFSHLRYELIKHF
ncbi:MAG: GNAT family N-acetyltransferase [Chloroflexi bacterium]|uniref:GNAT family N-acetyltransferase n=1 Tax=Candidatus Chlorohelix allophototropha TaxID=3003348 RepID=A0A8T7M9B0_9CHLR|nr:GNAT family N-acetyltransferase [Chloroflexota bacterium]WJW68668.1 GNAT family N-acetyltransferase [Chloroflexota bacterium L227-S17]